MAPYGRGGDQPWVHGGEAGAGCVNFVRSSAAFCPHLSSGNRRPGARTPAPLDRRYRFSSGRRAASAFLLSACGQYCGRWWGVVARLPRSSTARSFSND